MGRRDAVQVIVEVVARMRLLDPRLIVTYEPGWEKRGNGTSANYEGGIWHHTATPTSLSRPFPTQRLLRDGRSDLRGPLCNFAGPACTVERPTIHVMAAHPANHAGASGGRSMGPLPKTSLFNPRVLGLEIDYAGNAPMLPGQRHVARLWARAVADVVGGGDINRVRGHMETSVTGKWDPGYAPGKTEDLNRLRRESAALGVPQGIPVIGAIAAAYNRKVLGEATWAFFLGAPKGTEVGTLDKVGRWQEFKAGAILYHPEVDSGIAHVVWGDILQKFWAMGAETRCGYPTTDEMATPDLVGRYNHFAHPDAGVHFIKGAIREKWAALGWEVGFGYPTTDETPTPNGNGAYNHFTGNRSIYWSPSQGAVAVSGEIRDAWAASGWEAGAGGFPVSDPVVQGDVVTQVFQGGTATFSLKPSVSFQPTG